MAKSPSSRSNPPSRRGKPAKSKGSGSERSQGGARSNRTGKAGTGKDRTGKDGTQSARTEGASGRGAPRRTSSRGGTGSRGGTDRKGTGKEASGRRSTGSAGDTSRRSRTDEGTRGGKGRRRDLHGAAANLPNWVVEGLSRVTPDKRVGAALEALGEASEAFAEGAYHRAVRKALQAKELAPRDATVRETLGVAAYRTGDWQTALAELRTFRRLSGETTHMPIEMDALRGLGRDRDVLTAWATLQELGGRPAVMKEGAVVYASHLADQGELEQAWDVIAPRKIRHEPFPEDLRMWYVAARVAAMRGDGQTAARLRDDILSHDPGFPGVDELDKLIAAL